MGLTGRLTGSILLVFEDRSGLALVDLLLHQPVGTTDGLGRAGAVGRQGDDQHRRLRVCQCPGAPTCRRAGGQGTADAGELVPTPPSFLHEFAGSLLEFALMEQALELDQVLLIRSEFAGGPAGPEPQLDAALHPEPRCARRAGRVAGPARNPAASSVNEVATVPITPRDRLTGIRRGRLRGDRPMGRRRGAGADPDAAGLVRGRRPLRSGQPSSGAWPTSCCPRHAGPVDHPGKYADTAIPAVIAEFDRRLGPELATRLTAKLAGGASMFQVDRPSGDSALNIGRRNQEAIEADPRRADDPRPGPRPGRHDRTPLDPGHGFGHRRHQGARGRRL